MSNSREHLLEAVLLRHNWGGWREIKYSLELGKHPCSRDVHILIFKANAYPEKDQMPLFLIPYLGFDSYCSIFWVTIGSNFHFLLWAPDLKQYEKRQAVLIQVFYPMGKINHKEMNGLQREHHTCLFFKIIWMKIFLLESVTGHTTVSLAHSIVVGTGPALRKIARWASEWTDVSLHCGQIGHFRTNHKYRQYKESAGTDPVPLGPTGEASNWGESHDRWDNYRYPLDFSGAQRLVFTLQLNRLHQQTPWTAFPHLFEVRN